MQRIFLLLIVGLLLGLITLQVFVHPLCGKGRGVKNWETVAPLFGRANIKTKVNFISDF